MQIRITDLTEGCCPERAEPGKRDAELVRRIEREVFIKLNMDRRQLRRRNILRTVLIAAVIAALMTVTAFAPGSSPWSAIRWRRARKSAATGAFTTRGRAHRTAGMDLPRGQHSIHLLRP